MGRIMALDYGTKRTGIAVSDPLRLIASPLVTLPTREVFAYLKDYFSSQEVDVLVLGDPEPFHGEDLKIKHLADDFFLKLKKEFPGKDFHRFNERFTSVLAGRAILEAGAPKKIRRDKSLVDKVSAAIILRDFMESFLLKR